MPPGDARKSCTSCLNEKKDGRSAQSVSSSSVYRRSSTLSTPLVMFEAGKENEDQQVHQVPERFGSSSI